MCVPVSDDKNTPSARRFIRDSCSFQHMAKSSGRLRATMQEVVPFPPRPSTLNRMCGRICREFVSSEKQPRDTYCPVNRTRKIHHAEIAGTRRKLFPPSRQRGWCVYVCVRSDSRVARCTRTRLQMQVTRERISPRSSERTAAGSSARAIITIRSLEQKRLARESETREVASLFIGSGKYCCA